MIVRDGFILSFASSEILLLRQSLHSSGAAVLLYDRDSGHATEALVSNTISSLAVPLENVQLPVKQV
jgi:hypothetical protein